VAHRVVNDQFLSFVAQIWHKVRAGRPLLAAHRV
jgi:hypothetical protein